MKQDIGIYAGSKISRILKKSIEEALKTGSYLNESDFVRDAIREKLKRESITTSTGVAHSEEGK